MVMQRSGMMVLLVSLLTVTRALCLDRICSTEKVNGDCTIYVDRLNPVTFATIPMRPGKKVSVKVLNPLPFETLSLDPQGAQAIAGTDQTSGFVTAALAGLKGPVAISTEISQGAGRSAFFPATAAGQAVQNNLDALSNSLININVLMAPFLLNAQTVYLQLQEILSPIPRPVDSLNKKFPIRPNGIPATFPDPWADYAAWRAEVLCELKGCADVALY